MSIRARRGVHWADHVEVVYNFGRSCLSNGGQKPGCSGLYGEKGQENKGSEQICSRSLLL